MAPKKQQEPDLKLVAFHDIHIAMLDFLMRRLGENRQRNEHIRRAVREYALNHPAWDIKAFKKFARETALQNIPKTSNRRTLFARQVEALSEEKASAPVVSFDSEEMDFEL